MFCGIQLTIFRKHWGKTLKETILGRKEVVLATYVPLIWRDKFKFSITWVSLEPTMLILLTASGKKWKASMSHSTCKLDSHWFPSEDLFPQTCRFELHQSFTKIIVFVSHPKRKPNNKDIVSFLTFCLVLFNMYNQLY